MLFKEQERRNLILNNKKHDDDDDDMLTPEELEKLRNQAKEAIKELLES